MLQTMTTLVHIDIGGVELDAEDTPPPRIVRSREQSHSNGGYNRAALNVPCIAFQIWPRWHCWRLWPSRPPLPRMRGGASDGHHRWVKFLRLVEAPVCMAIGLILALSACVSRRRA